MHRFTSYGAKYLTTAMFGSRRNWNLMNCPILSFHFQPVKYIKIYWDLLN